ncbi:unnamed protein product [Pleuronectes platessa]|uniref:Uncharacterized protein n=1 Tax=Pleuronectes platessa TaxID=8262 RepID=A0A9N7U3L1_PLEPL|nr:unnamed protein product [Pleuronectes platessa]
MPLECVIDFYLTGAGDDDFAISESRFQQSTTWPGDTKEWRDLSYNFEPSPHSLLPKGHNGPHSRIQPKTPGILYSFYCRTQFQPHGVNAHKTSTAGSLQPQPQGLCHLPSQVTQDS